MKPMMLRLALPMMLGLAAPAMAADLLVKNVNGYTLDSHGQLQRFDALLVDHGKVEATGQLAALQPKAGAADRKSVV